MAFSWASFEDNATGSTTGNDEAGAHANSAPDKQLEAELTSRLVLSIV
jgi:hypothetical protein